MSKKSKALTIDSQEKTGTDGQRNAKAALLPSVNAAVVMTAYQSNIVGKDVDLLALVDGLRDSFSTAKAGDVSNLEAMLIGQATALQSIFTSLARRAQVQEYQKNLEAFLGLALKAQAQSRATIQAVIELKYPRQVAYVKQANIAHGPQQVNNGNEIKNNRTNTRTHAEENSVQQSKLLEGERNGGTYLDNGATTAAGGSDPALETVGAVNRTEDR